MFRTTGYSLSYFIRYNRFFARNNVRTHRYVYRIRIHIQIWYIYIYGTIWSYNNGESDDRTPPPPSIWLAFKMIYEPSSDGDNDDAHDILQSAGGGCTYTYTHRLVVCNQWFDRFTRFAFNNIIRFSFVTRRPIKKKKKNVSFYYCSNSFPDDGKHFFDDKRDRGTGTGDIKNRARFVKSRIRIVTAGATTTRVLRAVGEFVKHTILSNNDNSNNFMFRF